VTHNLMPDLSAAIANITVVIPVSPIQSHPDTDILCATIDSVNHHLPGARIFLTFDGLRETQEHMREQYAEHIRRCHELIWRDPVWRKVTPYVFPEHVHQVGMMRHVIEDIKTPLLMYVEQDMMIRVGRPIDFAGICGFLLRGRSDCVRLYLRPFIPEIHQDMMYGFDDYDLRFMRTSQWSQNVHVATVQMYREMLDEYFSADANCYIEDAVWGRIKDAYPRFKLHIYHPDTDVKFLLHLDGRRGDSKYEQEQVY
jgi:hypothetical protein